MSEPTLALIGCFVTKQKSFFHRIRRLKSTRVRILFISRKMRNFKEKAQKSSRIRIQKALMRFHLKNQNRSFTLLLRLRCLFIHFLSQAVYLPGSTLHGYLSKILARSCQDLGKTLAKILPRYWQELQDVMVRSYQESHVPKKTFIVKSYLE